MPPQHLRKKQDCAFSNRPLSFLGGEKYFDCYDICQEYGRRSKMCVLKSPAHLFCQIAFPLSVLRKLNLTGQLLTGGADTHTLSHRRTQIGLDRDIMHSGGDLS